MSPARDVVERFIAGWENLSSEEIVQTISAREPLLIWGTDEDEVWLDQESFDRSVREQVEAFDDPKYQWSPGDPFEIADGSSALVAGTLEVDLNVEGTAVHVDMRSSFFLRSNRGEWSIVHGHFSTAQADRVVDY